MISGLPPNYSWQDLKDLMRKGGKVIYTEVNGVDGYLLLLFIYIFNLI